VSRLHIHYAEHRYAECRYAECRGALVICLHLKCSTRVDSHLIRKYLAAKSLAGAKRSSLFCSNVSGEDKSCITKAPIRFTIVFNETRSVLKLFSEHNLCKTFI
jgi:hypothetical protein